MEKFTENQHPKELRYALTDYWVLCSKFKRFIFICIFFGALLSGGYALTRNVYFLTTATFRDKGKPQTTFRSSLSDFIFSNGSMAEDSETISTLKSRKLLSKVIQELGMQALVAPVHSSFIDWSYFWDNLLAEYAYWTKTRMPILKELDQPFIARNVAYRGEVPSGIVVQIVDDAHFKILSEKENVVGAFGELYVGNEYSFVLKKTGTSPLKAGQLFTIGFLPLDLAVQTNASQMVIEIDREDKTLLRLNYRHRNRQFAAEFLNTLMDAYQDHLKNEHKYLSNFQLDYLKSRQDEVGSDLQVMMEKHALRISNDLSSNGFLDSEKEMDFLAGNMHNLQQKISEIDFEKKRLEKLNDLEFVYYDQYGGRGDSAVINQLLGEIRGLKQQIDVLNFSLEKQRKLDNVAVKNILDGQFAELHDVRAKLKEAKELSMAIKSGENLTSTDTLFQPSQEIAPIWFNSINHFTSEEDQLCYKTQLCSYLDNLSDMLRLKEATIGERIKHQHRPDEEFQGITLETAKALFLNYTASMTDLQSQIKQLNFIIEELHKPDFEVCSLTAVLHDPISAERIAKASMLLINLKDENNRTQKEMSRIRDELNMLKQFLAAHIEQMIQLYNLREKVLQDKIYALQSLTLELSYQQIYVLKKNLTDYLATRLDNLDNEKHLIHEHQSDLNARMSKIPSRWAAEKLVFQHLTSHQKFLENIASMVESKNISTNLELIQSTPLDLALPPVNPKPPRAVFYSVLGAILGLIGSVGFLIARSLVTGVPASEENLKFAHLHCSGIISKHFISGVNLLDSDLNTLRKLLGFLDQTLPVPRRVLMVCGQGANVSNDFASLISRKGQDVIHLDLSFDSVPKNEQQPGLMQYLETGQKPAITKEQGIASISSGGVSRYASELLSRQSFKMLLDELQGSFPWILATSHTSILDAGTLNLASAFDAVILIITDETIEEIKGFEEQLNRETSKVVDCLLIR
ncbi:putative Tyrosine-protein kinase [Chlamydiales bacterium STE3]|nr:putative Tyrosine-protein kinase [Chlamydiales bacterium STE3]